MAILGLDGSGFKAGLDRAAGQASEAGQQITSAWGHHLSSALAGMVSVGTIEEVVRRTIEYGEQISILAQRLGISTDAAQAWDYALKMNGSSLEANAKTFEKMAQSREKAMGGDEKAIHAFQKLGVAVDDLRSKRLEDIALQIAETFQSGDPQKLIGDLREVGGRGAGEMVAAFRSGLADLVREAKDAGVVMSESVVDGLRSAGERTKSVWMEIVAGVAPAVVFLSKLLQGLWRGLESATATAVGFFGGFQRGSGGPAQSIADMQKELEDKWKEQDRQEDERAKARKEKLTGGADDEENAKANRALDQEAKRKQELIERLAKLEEKHYLDSLTKEQQITELHRKRAELAYLLAENWGAMSEEQRLKAQIDVEELKGEEERAQREQDKPKKERLSGFNRNQLQAIGAYGAESPREQQMLDTTRKSEGHLREIKEHLVRNQHMPTNRGVNF